MQLLAYVGGQRKQASRKVFFYNLSTLETKAEDQEFKLHCEILATRPAWAA